jgi:hypothetical protein
VHRYFSGKRRKIDAVLPDRPLEFIDIGEMKRPESRRRDVTRAHFFVSKANFGKSNVRNRKVLNMEPVSDLGNVETTKKGVQLPIEGAFA